MSDQDASGNRWEPDAEPQNEPVETGAIPLRQQPDEPAPAQTSGGMFAEIAGEDVSGGSQSRSRSPQLRLAAAGAGLLLAGGILGGVGGYVIGSSGNGFRPASDHHEGGRFGGEPGSGNRTQPGGSVGSISGPNGSTT